MERNEKDPDDFGKKNTSIEEKTLKYHAERQWIVRYHDMMISKLSVDSYSENKEY